jgi:hypothetical protein
MISFLIFRELPKPAPDASPNIYKASEVLLGRIALLGGSLGQNSMVKA